MLTFFIALSAALLIAVIWQAVRNRKEQAEAAHEIAGLHNQAKRLQAQLNDANTRVAMTTEGNNRLQSGIQAANQARDGWQKRYHNAVDSHTHLQAQYNELVLQAEEVATATIQLIGIHYKEIHQPEAPLAKAKALQSLCKQTLQPF